MIVCYECYLDARRLGLDTEKIRLRDSVSDRTASKQLDCAAARQIACARNIGSLAQTTGAMRSDHATRNFSILIPALARHFRWQIHARKLHSARAVHRCHLVAPLLDAWLGERLDESLVDHSGTNHSLVINTRLIVAFLTLSVSVDSSG